MAIFLFFAALILDQVTKIWAAATQVNVNIIGDWMKFSFVQNPGAAFSMFGDKEWSTALFIAVAGVSVVAFFVVAAITKSQTLKCGLMLLASGALGNLIDRVCVLLQRKGVAGLTNFDIGVRDFIFPTFFANFNVADIAVTFGVALVVVYVLFLGEDPVFGKKKSKKPSEEEKK